MTRFLGDSVSVRGGKGGSGESMKQRKKNMEKFKETGQHPELDRMQKSIDKQIPALPLLDVHRCGRLGGMGPRPCEMGKEGSG